MNELLINTLPPYSVLIESGLMARTAALLERIAPRPGRLLVVTDTHVAPLYLDALLRALAPWEAETCVLPAGEEYKTPETLVTLLRTMARLGLTRSDLALALGGGVIGDMTGFAAAVYQRGMRFVQMPTTLLSAVDASVGGKTAVDLPEGKNLIGAFHQPSLVVCDPDCFRTLPELRWSDGAAEMIKHGMIADGALFDRMLDGSWRADLPGTVACNVAIKRSFVVGDEQDRGRRQLLNFGHTIGHAVEAHSGYRLSHGQAVAIGMVMETRAARKTGLADIDEGRLVEALKANGLPTETDTAAEDILQYALRDKKRQADSVTVAVPVAYGQARLEKLDLERFRDYVAAGGAA